MKKILYIAAFAAFALVSCQEKNAPVNEEKTDVLAFKASIEQPETKGNVVATGGASSDIARATINASNELVWADGDQICIYFPTWGEKYQSFTLSGGTGTSHGEFTRDQEGYYVPTDATIAFFPYDGAGGGNSNISDGVWYYKLKNWYDGYTSGKMLTPLIASLSSSENISFKHAGAAVQLTINNLVSGTYKVKLSVANKQITGYYHVTAANAGTEALVPNGEENADLNHITLNTYKGSGAFSWIFPVPELTTPKLTFEIKDENGVIVWTKSPKAQESLSRADLLVMPALDILAYGDMTEDETWSFSGNISGSGWNDNVPMVTDGNLSILSGCTFVAGDQFKIRKDHAWDEAYPSNNWVFTADNAGTKDIIFNRTTHEISVVAHKFPYPAVDLSFLATAIHINGDMSDWTGIAALGSTGTSRIRDWKYSSDADSLYFFFNLRKNKMFNGLELLIGFDYDESGSFSDGNLLTGCEIMAKIQPFTNESKGTPVCVNGIISTANINGSDVEVTIKAFGSDPNPSATGDSADYYLELSIPRSALTALGLPATGNVNVAASYEYYSTGLVSVAL